MHYLTFDLDLNVQITQTALQPPQHYVLYAPSQFKVAMFNSLGGGGRYIYKIMQFIAYNLDLGGNVAQTVLSYLNIM